jgi:hypothetical protein
MRGQTGVSDVQSVKKLRQRNVKEVNLRLRADARGRSDRLLAIGTTPKAPLQDNVDA